MKLILHMQVNVATHLMCGEIYCKFTVKSASKKIENY